MNRVWHPYMTWEDYLAGMYDLASDMPRQVAQACELLGNPEGLRDAMGDAIHAWPIAAEHYLSDLSSNRRAWVGQAACHHLLGVPAQATKAAWWQLTEEQREAANDAADSAIKSWEEVYGGAQTLFG